MQRALAGSYGEWDRSDYLAAHIIDSVNANTHAVIATSWSGKGERPQPPEPFPRPSSKDVPEDEVAAAPAEPKKFLTAAEMRAWKEEVSTPTVILYE